MEIFITYILLIKLNDFCLRHCCVEGKKKYYVLNFEEVYDALPVV
jgi:hypothetical protein